MSNDMNKQNDQKHEGSIDKKAAEAKVTDNKIADAYEDVSKESTSSEMDAMIMAMAQKEASSRAIKGDKEKGGQSWWHRLRFPVSITAALVVTVGIARFMVELGYYNPSTIAQSGNSPQAYDSTNSVVIETERSSEVAAAPVKVKREADSYSKQAATDVEAIKVSGARIKAEQREMSRVAKATARKEAMEAGQRVLESSQKESIDLLEKQMLEKHISQNVVKPQVPASPVAVKADDAMADNAVADNYTAEPIVAVAEAIPSEAIPLEDVPSKDVPSKKLPPTSPEKEFSEVERIVVTGSRIRATDIVSAEDAEQEMKPLSSEKNHEKQSVVESSSASLGGETAAEPPYLSACAWVESIKRMLEKKDIEQAKQQWLTFKQIYPDYELESSLFEQLEQL